MSREKRRYTNARERAEKHDSGFSSTSFKLPEGVNLFKPKEGVMLLDILPFVAGKGNPWAEPGNVHWERTYWAHRGVGANGDTYLCPAKSAKKPCPICEYRLKLIKEGDEDNEQVIKDLAPKERQLFNVVNLRDPDKGIQIWDVSNFLFGKVLDARLRNADEDDGWENFFHMEEGLTLKVSFAEESFGGYAFYKAETIDFKTRKEPYDDDKFEEVHCLDEILIIPEYDDLKKAFLEVSDDKPAKSKSKDKDADDDDEDDEDEKPAKGKKPAADEDEDDEDEKPVKPKSKKPADDDDEDEDDEEPAPKVKSKKTPPPDDADDWSEFDEDDEDDEKPAKAKSKKPADDDDDEDEAPAPKAKSKKPADDDDDEDTDDEDDEDEDAPPAKKKKPAAESDDEDDEEPAPKKKKNRFDSDEDDKGWDNDDDEEPAPKKKKKPADDDDDE